MKQEIYRLEKDIPKLLGTECTACQFRWFPAVHFGCEQCGAYGEDLKSKVFSGIGSVLSCVDVADGEGSFVLASIELDVGPVLRGIIEATGSTVIGEKVEAFVANINGEDAIRFRKCND
jgi:uncharacterized OB-fold protein